MCSSRGTPSAAAARSISLVAAHAGCEGPLLSLFLDRGEQHIGDISAGPHKGHRGDEAGQLIHSDQGLLYVALGMHASQRRRVRRDVARDHPRPALRAQIGDADVGMALAVQIRVALIVKIVVQAEDAP